MAVTIHSSPPQAWWQRREGTGRQPIGGSFVSKIVDDIAPNERLEHGVKGSPPSRIALEFLERFPVAKDHDGAEIERLLQAGLVYRQGAAKAHVVDTADAAEGAQAAQENILVINVVRSFQPKQHYVGDLAGMRAGSVHIGRSKEKGETNQNNREAHTKKCICGANTIAQNLSASIHFRLLFSDMVE
jgi:hypothetical protein